MSDNAEGGMEDELMAAQGEAASSSNRSHAVIANRVGNWGAAERRKG